MGFLLIDVSNIYTGFFSPFFFPIFVVLFVLLLSAMIFGSVIKRECLIQHINFSGDCRKSFQSRMYA